VRLHPVTQLLLFAVALRLAADAIFISRASQLLWYWQNWPLDLGQDSLTPEVNRVGSRMTELAQTVANLGGAAFVEFISRWANQLKAARLQRSRRPEG